MSGFMKSNTAAAAAAGCSYAKPTEAAGCSYAKPTEAAGCRYNVQGQLVCGADAVRGAPKAASAGCWAVNARTSADVTLQAGVANQGERLYGAVCQKDADCGPFLSCQAAEMTPQRFCVVRHRPLSLPVAPASAASQQKK